MKINADSQGGLGLNLRPDLIELLKSNPIKSISRLVNPLTLARYAQSKTRPQNIFNIIPGGILINLANNYSIAFYFDETKDSIIAWLHSDGHSKHENEYLISEFCVEIFQDDKEYSTPDIWQACVGATTGKILIRVYNGSNIPFEDYQQKKIVLFLDKAEPKIILSASDPCNPFTIRAANSIDTDDNTTDILI